jgi:hypothetical protein
VRDALAIGADVGERMSATSAAPHRVKSSKNNAARTNPKAIDSGRPIPILVLLGVQYWLHLAFAREVI